MSNVDRMETLAALLDSAADELPSMMEKVKLAYHMAKQIAELLREGAKAVAEKEGSTTNAECVNREATCPILCPDCKEYLTKDERDGK